MAREGARRAGEGAGAKLELLVPGSDQAVTVPRLWPGSDSSSEECLLELSSILAVPRGLSGLIRAGVGIQSSLPAMFWSTLG